jgi:cytoskeletal protein RodZ
MGEFHSIIFRSKPVSAIQTVAELLVFARQQRQASIEDVAQDLQISPFYLEALEQGDYARLPCLVYSRNFVKQYGLWLGLNISPLVTLFEEEWKLFEKLQPVLLDVPRREGVKSSDLWKLPRYARLAVASTIVLAVFGYLGLELYQLRQPPQLLVDSPAEEQMVTKQLVQVRGQTEPEAEISINNQTILSDVNGRFNENVALLPGVNVIEIQAKKKYSRENKVYRKIIVTEQPTITSEIVEPPIS